MDLATPSPTSSSDFSFVASSDQIVLSETDRSRLQTFVHAGHESARARTRAQVLLKLGEGWGLQEVCRAFDVCRNTVAAVRHRFDEGGVDAEYVCIVQDNLNTHTAGALYETFPPKQARRILTRLEFHYTPKHGSWLNQAEIEISIFARGCLSRPVPDLSTLEQRVRALEDERNA